MDPKQQSSNSPTSKDSATAAPEPIAPLPADGITGASLQPGQVIKGAKPPEDDPSSATGSTDTTSSADAVTGSPSPSTSTATPTAAKSATAMSIPIYDSTANSQASSADAQPAETPAAGDQAESMPPAIDSTEPTVDTPADKEPTAPESESPASASPSTSTDEYTPDPVLDPDAKPEEEIPTALTPEPSSSDGGDDTIPAINPVTAPEHKPGGAKKWLVVVLIVILVAGLAAGAAMMLLKKDNAKKTTKAPVKVGFLMALTGGSASMGYGTNKGIQLAKKQLGADNIEIVQADSKCDPKVAPEAIKRLIAQHVVAIIGDGCSSASTAALPAANNAKIPLISPSASSPALSIPNDYFFRVIPNDNFQGAFMAQSIFDKGIRKVAVFYTNESYGSSMSKVFKEKFESLGGKVATSVSAESDVIDLTNEMNTLKASKPEAIFFSPNSVVSATAAIKVAREVGITVPFYGADAFYDTTVIKDSGPAAATGLTITSFPTGSKSFKQALLNEYQVTEQLYGSAQAYDAFHAIYLAIKQGATNGEQVAKALPSISFEGVSAHISFDDNGEISDKNYKYALLQVKNGEFVAVE